MRHGSKHASRFETFPVQQCPISEAWPGCRPQWPFCSVKITLWLILPFRVRKRRRLLLACIAWFRVWLWTMMVLCACVVDAIHLYRFILKTLLHCSDSIAIFLFNTTCSNSKKNHPKVDANGGDIVSGQKPTVAESCKNAGFSYSAIAQQHDLQICKYC